MSLLSYNICHGPVHAFVCICGHVFIFLRKAQNGENFPESKRVGLQPFTVHFVPTMEPSSNDRDALGVLNFELNGSPSSDVASHFLQCETLPSHYGLLVWQAEGPPAGPRRQDCV